LERLPGGEAEKGSLQASGGGGQLLEASPFVKQTSILREDKIHEGLLIFERKKFPEKGHRQREKKKKRRGVTERTGGPRASLGKKKNSPMSFQRRGRLLGRKRQRLAGGWVFSKSAAAREAPQE